MQPLIDGSPCIGVCRLDEHAVCSGCGRHIAEIERWRELSPAQRHAINLRLLAGASDAVRHQLLQPLGAQPAD